ncbi:hypothetical protein [Paeniglutamicibacter sp.]|uniref:hypothetical protein n=1 Tax=Paeniglutamicibacter sp. TaxID=1934391 RepID=UPI00398A15C8
MKKFVGSVLATMLFAGALFVGGAADVQQSHTDEAAQAAGISRTLGNNNWPL